MHKTLCITALLCLIGCSKPVIEQAQGSPDKPATELRTGVKAPKPGKVTPQAMMDRLDRIEALLSQQYESKLRDEGEVKAYLICQRTCEEKHAPFKGEAERDVLTKCYTDCEKIRPLTYTGGC